jgi:hypothetical protein
MDLTLCSDDIALESLLHLQSIRSMAFSLADVPDRPVRVHQLNTFMQGTRKMHEMAHVQALSVCKYILV